MDLEIADQLVDIVAIADQAGNDHEGAGLGRDALLELVTDQADRRDEIGDQRVEQAGRPFRSRQGKGCKQQQHRAEAKAGAGEEPAGERHRRQGEDDNGQGNRQPAELAHQADGRLQQRRPVIDGLFQRLPAGADQHIAEIGRAACLGNRHGVGHFDRLLGDREFGVAGSAGQPLDGLAVFIARAAVEHAVIGLVEEQAVNRADLLDPDSPFGIVHLPQTADDVAHGHIAGRQAVVLRHHHFLGVGAGLLQPLLQPGNRQGRCLRSVTQAIEELGGEGIVLGQRLDAVEQRRVAGCIVQPDQLVGDLVCLAAHAARALDANGDTAKILDQNIAHHRGQRPELADLQRLDRLEPLDQRRQALARNRRMGVGDIEPGERDGARQLGAADIDQRQLTIEFLRKVAAHLLDRFLDDIVIVEQPFGSRGNCGTLRDIGGGGAIDAQDLALVLLVAGKEIEGRKGRQRIGPAGPGERGPAGMQFFHGEVGRPDGIIVVDLLGLGIARRCGGLDVKRHGSVFWDRRCRERHRCADGPMPTC